MSHKNQTSLHFPRLLHCRSSSFRGAILRRVDTTTPGDAFFQRHRCLTTVYPIRGTGRLEVPRDVDPCVYAIDE
jgi:hypothetical protein